MIRFAANEVMQPKCLDSHKVRGELSIRRHVLAGRDEQMVLKNDLEVLSVDNSGGLIWCKPSRQLFKDCNS
jgi:hypothetical protein